ncbi:endonuclease/exonuclease/phosphatase family protein [Frankia sp. CNm7]|uniref:Endonuclease/exonuclease/phosphatase family protein n=1 Tax=Frankia nepalensis TaxID=1836974 RepID=A0A937UTN9_9ACTN|nr:endonuclease/exonuclease/phosphatase family protein [Frankia nepalensis]MBL7500819.1 endonuclease/exonuclease/phosphatase family protein [Frankia nepalensis]MBL7514557.1 endonuclease/exonuclease/phosphatase family protein [Frankia nepalensis]MBL7524404.1 endonuclease/exonuclease/phosphatase family protein [Frankia nepalensis]MBL7631455.1 endonuclease/exonuclease/phosphatase family protein [Frankia nepalensis]
MRLGTFNVLHGRSPDDGAVDLARFRAAVASLDCDVLALQEVDVGQSRSGGADLCAAAADALGIGADGWRFEATVYGTPGLRSGPGSGPGPAPGPAWRPADGPRSPGEPAYGIALVSRFPVRGWRVVPLGRSPVRSPVAVPGPDGRPRLVLLDDEPRAAIVAELATPAGPLTVAGTHLSFVPGWNAAQLRRLGRALRLGGGGGAAGGQGTGGPAVILGDLNLPGPLPRLLTGWRRLAAAPTYPARAPRVQFDHVLARGAVPPAVAAWTEQTAISDHRALLVDLADG